MNNSKLKRFHLILKPKLYFILSLALFFRLPGFDAVLVSDELAMVSLWGQIPYEKNISKLSVPQQSYFINDNTEFFTKVIWVA